MGSPLLGGPVIHEVGDVGNDHRAYQEQVTERLARHTRQTANLEALLDQERQTLGDLQAQMAFVDEQMMGVRVAPILFNSNLPNNAGLAILNAE
jgi:hypothetical protein